MSLNHIRPWRNIERRKSRQIMVGNVPVGGDAPISVQTMTNTLTTDVKGTIAQIQAAADAGADIVMLDNFTNEQIQQAVAMNNAQCKLEVSGNITDERLASLSKLGVDYISSGALTKHVHAVDLSLRIQLD